MLLAPKPASPLRAICIWLPGRGGRTEASQVGLALCPPSCARRSPRRGGGTGLSAPRAECARLAGRWGKASRQGVDRAEDARAEAGGGVPEGSAVLPREGVVAPSGEGLDHGGGDVAGKELGRLPSGDVRVLLRDTFGSPGVAEDLPPISRRQPCIWDFLGFPPLAWCARRVLRVRHKSTSRDELFSTSTAIPPSRTGHCKSFRHVSDLSGD
mmetsp:Transcript_56707/g.100600  ORF Transcript_56707/g.100600 Transcript_56707/m.100600 type:complete len:212 (+) Transcript_56707:4424-5059(+)